jgi:hypothetical protein
LKVYARQTGEDFPAWSEEIDITTPIITQVHQSEDLTKQLITVKPLSPVKPVVKTYGNSANRSKTNKAKPILLILLPTAILISITGLVVLIFWMRSTQIQILTQSKNLGSKIEEIDNKSNLENLKDIQKQLQAVLSNLDKAPNIPLPGSIYSEIAGEKQKINTQLESIKHNIDSLEKLLPQVKEAIQQFAAVNSRLDVGLSYRNYGEQVGNLKVTLDGFAQNPGAKEHPVYNDLSEAFVHYDTALNVWRNYINSDATHNFFRASSSYGNLLISEYQVETQNIVGQDYIYLPKALNKIWQKASEKVKLAQSKIN